VPVDSAIYNAVAGRYEKGSGQWIEPMARDGYLVGSTDGRYWDEVMASSGTEFFIDGRSWDFTFSWDSDGTVVGLVISSEGMNIPARKIR
jgi:hypothetical protein